jgi:hypothetical protein
MTGGLSVPDTGGQESSRTRCLREHECGLDPAVRTNLLLASVSGAVRSRRLNGMAVAPHVRIATLREHRPRDKAPAPTRLRCRCPLPTQRVGLFVGMFCQPASGFWRFIAVDSPMARSAESPANTESSRKSSNAGGGTRTPDTRIMIPRVDT